MRPSPLHARFALGLVGVLSSFAGAHAAFAQAAPSPPSPSPPAASSPASARAAAPPGETRAPTGPEDANEPEDDAAPDAGRDADAEAESRAKAARAPHVARATPVEWNGDDPYVPHNPPEVPLLSATRGFAAAFQAGESAPVGATSGAADDDLARTFAGQFSMLGEVGVRVTSAVFVGIYAGYAVGDPGSGLQQTCDRFDCSAYSARAGLAVRYRWYPGLHVQPWIGYAAGYEKAGFEVKTGSRTLGASFSGWELARVSFGLDYSDGALYGLGPVVELGAGQFDHVTVQGSSTATDADITQTAMHAWLTVGLRWTIMP